MKSSRLMSVLAFLIAGTLIAQEAKVTPLMSKDLADFPGKEGLMITARLRRKLSTCSIDVLQLYYRVVEVQITETK